MPTRKYEQSLRAEAAEETRGASSMRSTRASASSRPSRSASDQIARLARVARSTIYLIFGSRAGLFDALAAELFRTGEFARVEAAAAEPDAREYLRGGVRGATEMLAAHRDVFRVLYSMAQLDPNAVGGAVHGWRKRGPGDGAHRGATGRAGPAARRRDGRRRDSLIWLLGSFDAFDLLYTGRGLSVDEIVELFVETVERALYA